jgi:hypothetical protein
MLKTRFTDIGDIAVDWNASHRNKYKLAIERMTGKQTRYKNALALFISKSGSDIFKIDY